MRRTAALLAALTVGGWIVRGEGGSPAPASPAAAAAGAALKAIDPPAPPGSTSPAIATELPTPQATAHDILLTWLTPGTRGGKLMFGRYSEGSWFPSVTVAEPVAMLGPNDPPSLTVLETQGVRRTLIARTGDVVARSGDGGRTWERLPSAPLPLSSFAGGDEGGYAFWPVANADGAAKLLGTRILAGETLLDPLMAAGAGTAAAMTWDGPIVAYRDSDAKGALGVAVIRRQDAKWVPPQTLEAVGWRPARAPQYGPAVSALKRQVAVAWTTGAPLVARLLVAFSADAGKSFGAPIEVDAGDGDHWPSGPVAIALADDGEALVVWSATHEPAPAVLNLARVAPDGRRGEALVLARAAPSQLWGLPQIARAGERVAVTWIEGVLARVRAATVAESAIPAAVEPRPAASAESAAARPYRGHGRVGDLLPGFTFTSLGGERVSFAALSGRAVLLNLWATWCAPCVAEMPELAALLARHGKEGLVVVGVSVDSADAVAKVQGFVSERKLPFEVWLDPEMVLSNALRVQGLPSTFIADRDGRIVLRRDQPITADDPELEAALRRVLN